MCCEKNAYHSSGSGPADVMKIFKVLNCHDAMIKYVMLIKAQHCSNHQSVIIAVVFTLFNKLAYWHNQHAGKQAT